MFKRGDKEGRIIGTEEKMYPLFSISIVIISFILMTELEDLLFYGSFWCDLEKKLKIVFDSC